MEKYLNNHDNSNYNHKNNFNSDTNCHLSNLPTNTIKDIEIS